jgi:hypothetical protein
MTLGESRKGSKENIRIPLELSYRHLLQTPSHDFLQKAKGWVVRITRACEDDSNESLQRRRWEQDRKYRYISHRLYREMPFRSDGDQLENRPY